jgi:hypothetical protein
MVIVCGSIRAPAVVHSLSQSRYSHHAGDTPRGSRHYGRAPTGHGRNYTTQHNTETGSEIRYEDVSLMEWWVVGCGVCVPVSEFPVLCCGELSLPVPYVLHTLPIAH